MFDTVLNGLVIVVSIVAVILGVVLLITIIQNLRWETVAEEERIVIYRFGRFQGVRGPGLVHYNPMFHEIRQRINVRSEAKRFTVGTLFIFGIPIGYTMDIWCRNDPVAAATKDDHVDREQLRRLVQFTDIERHGQARELLLNHLYKVMDDLEKAHPLPKNAQLFHMLLPALPGLPPCNKMLADVQRDLVEPFRRIGIIMETDYPITIHKLHLDGDLASNFGRGRTIRMLREQFPNMPDDLIAQIMSSVEGIDPPKVDRFLLDGSGDMNTRLEFRQDEEGNSQKRIKIDGRNNEPPNKSGDDSGDEATEPAAAALEDGRLQPQDYGVLKQVPRYRDSSRKVG